MSYIRLGLRRWRKTTCMFWLAMNFMRINDKSCRIYLWLGLRSSIKDEKGWEESRINGRMFLPCLQWSFSETNLGYVFHSYASSSLYIQGHKIFVNVYLTWNVDRMEQQYYHIAKVIKLIATHHFLEDQHVSTRW